MSTTTARLSDESKARIAEAAERQAEFYAEAERRYAEFLKTGKSIPWDEMRRYLKSQLAGKSVKRPVARKLDVACMRYFRAT